MKLWEETWHWNDDGSEVVTRYPDTEEYRRVGLVGCTDRVIVETDSGCYPPREGERELIVAAPEMARLLLALHEEHGDRRTFDWAYWHDEIETVLRKAGVLRHGEEP